MGSARNNRNTLPSSQKAGGPSENGLSRTGHRPVRMVKMVWASWEVERLFLCLVRGPQTGTAFRGGDKGRIVLQNRKTFRRQTLAVFACFGACKKTLHSGNTEVRLHLLRKNEVGGRTIRAQKFCGNGFLTISQWVGADKREWHASNDCKASINGSEGGDGLLA